MMEQKEKAGIKNRMQECVSGADRKDSDIMVSICCITYNQASYIRDALEGFVNQKTDFAYEVLIHDDASTDGTADIIREYADRYPDLIFPILQTENQYSKGLTNVSGTFNFPRARGKYIAMCEGDDYWTDDRKLQKQVDYLEANPGCSLCFHSAAAWSPRRRSLTKLPGIRRHPCCFIGRWWQICQSFITMPLSRIFHCSSFARTGAGPGIWMSLCVCTVWGEQPPGLRL